jgi:hypothetical protein
VTPFDAFHLPVPPGRCRELEQHGVRARVPVLDEADIASICRSLVSARAALLAMPADRIIAAIDAAAAVLALERARLVDATVAFTGYSPQMAGHVLERMARDWSARALHDLVNAEFGGTGALDRFITRSGGVRSTVISPALGLHVFAGNVPGVSITSIIRSLLVRTAVFGKTAAAEPVLAPAFARQLAAADPDLGRCVAVTWWPGGDTTLEAAALRHAGIVVHYGGARAIASLRARAPADIAFIDHGPRVSLAVVRPGGTRERLDIARDIARAVATFDQQGCVSPQALYVLGDASSARDLAEAAAHALNDIAHSLPRGRIDAGEAAAIRELRASAEFRAIAGEQVELWVGTGLDWTVIFDADPAFTGSCLNRTLLVKPVADLDQLATVLRPIAGLLQTVGIAGFGTGAEAVARQLGNMGATRVTPIAAMPWPPPAWHHDGRGPLTELSRWLDLEPAG